MKILLVVYDNIASQLILYEGTYPLLLTEQHDSQCHYYRTPVLDLR